MEHVLCYKLAGGRFTNNENSAGRPSRCSDTVQSTGRARVVGAESVRHVRTRPRSDGEWQAAARARHSTPL